MLKSPSSVDASLLTGCAVATKEIISTPEAPSAIGPYSQAVKFGGMLFISGQIPVDPATGQVKTASIEEQTKQVMENLKAVLRANQMDMSHLVSTTVFLTDLNDFVQMNIVYGAYFDEQPPARATVQVARLPKDVSIEVSAIAAK